MKSSQSNSVYGGNSRELKNSAKSSFTSTTLFILAVLKRGVEFCKFVMAEDSCVKPTKADEGAFVPVKSAWGERSCEVSDQFKRIWIAHLDQLTTIDFPGAGQTYGSGINDRGEVVGFTNEGHCYLWRDGEFTTIDFPGARNTTPWGINKHGQIVGTYYEQPSGLAHGFLLEDGDYSSIDFPDGSNTAALGINNNGDIVGWYERNVNGVFGHGYLYSEGQFLSIDEPDAMLSTIPFGINDRGDIVGSYIPADRTNHGFLATGCQ